MNYVTNNKNNTNKNRGVLKDLYDIIEKIGSGSFGDVYLSVNKLNPLKKIAAKVERKDSSKERVYNEYKIYRRLHKNNNIFGIPKVYEFVQTADYNIMFMELLNSSLDELFIEHKKKFKLNTVIKLGIDIVLLLKNIHDNNFIHRDIKPNNFMIGRDGNIDKIYIMDFGLSKRYKDKNDKHINFHKNRSLIGTARYASVNMHMGLEPSRRDDLESAGYMLIYFLKGSLPWQGLKRKKKGKEHLVEIGNVKMSTPLDVLCEDLPSCFKDYIKYCRDLSFEQQPDYDYLISLFKNAKEEHSLDLYYEWIK